jgi:hypothetical protein
LPSGSLSLLAGKPKAGKSTLTRCLVLAVARGEPWLGFKTTQGPVLYFAPEEKRAEVLRHFTALGARENDPIELSFAPAPADALAQLRTDVERARPVLVVVDTLLRLIRVRDANDYAAMMAALEPLHVLARETGAHVLAVHHLGKGERSGGDAILGSTAIFGTVDTALLLKRTERHRILSSVQRYGSDLEEMTLEHDPVTRAVSAGAPRQDAEEAEMAAVILDYLTPLSQPVDEPTIHDAVEGRRQLKVRGLRRLVACGRVQREGSGRKGDPFRYAAAGPDSDFLVPVVPRELPEPENQNPEPVRVAPGGPARHTTEWLE